VPEKAVTKTASPETIGQELPSPGRSRVQASPSEALHFVGTVSELTPCAFGPRNWGQSAFAAVRKVVSSRENGIKAFMKAG
jgi:hypothetical protein